MLYNLYGSTEVAYAAVATPEDLAADPRTAGKAPHGVTLRVVDEKGKDVPPGESGRIFVGSGLSFEGYTDGSDKDRLDGLIATGDLGTLDEEGRLTVLGRDDDMVVIGGENVFVGQVEDALLAHAAVVRRRGRRRRRPVVRDEARRPRRAVGEGGRRRSCRTGCARSWRGSPYLARCRCTTSCRATRPGRSSSGSCRS